MAASYHARCCPDLREQFEVQCLARGRFSMWTGGAGDRSANPGTSGPHALPPEPQPPQTGIKSTETHIFSKIIPLISLVAFDLSAIDQQLILLMVILLNR